MKKFIIAAATVAFIGLGGTPALAQSDSDPVPSTLPTAPDPLPIECCEQDEGFIGGDGTTVGDIPEQCIDFYVEEEQAPPPGLDVSGVVPTCVADAPAIFYSVVGLDFTLPDPFEATITLRDVNNVVVDVVTVNTPTGTILWPGATVDANGNATDWPGWIQTNTGEWVEDPTDAYLRDGLTVTIEVNPTATASVSYPPSSEICSDPPPPLPPLPKTGSSMGMPLQIGAVLLVLGGITLVATRRRNTASAAS